MVDLLRVCANFKQPSLDEIAYKLVNFGPSDRQKVLVLDMDETLIHAKFLMTTAQEKADDGDYVVSIATASGSDSVKISVKMRPFLDNCLEHLAKYYEIAVFTAGEQSYADAVLDYLDEERQIIKHRLYRQHCIKAAEGIYVKDLRVIRDRDLANIILVDNSIVSFAFNLDNGVPISAFTRQKHDEELLYLVSYLEEVFSFPDVREQIGKTFQLREQMKKHSGKAL
jgi:CTD small phosphatase-like protein 2